MRLFISNFKNFFYALLIIFIIEGCVYYFFKHDSFHTNVMSFSFMEKLNIQRFIISEKINQLADKQAEFIQVGDSSGLYGVKPRIVMKYLHGATYVNDSCCADSGFAGYRYIAEKFLRSNKNRQYLVLHMTPWTSPLQNGAGFSNLLKDALVAPQHVLYDYLPSMAMRLDITNMLYHGKFQHQVYHDNPGARQWSEMLSETLGWLPFLSHPKKPPPSGVCNFGNYYDQNKKIVFYSELEKMKKLADAYKVKLIIIFNPTSCTRGSVETEAVIQEIARFKQNYPDVYIPFPFITTWPAADFHDAWHLREQAAIRHSKDIGRALVTMTT